MNNKGLLVILLCTPFGVSVHTITTNTGRLVTRDVLDGVQQNLTVRPCYIFQRKPKLDAS